MFPSGNAAEILKEWNVTGKKKVRICHVTYVMSGFIRKREHIHSKFEIVFHRLKWNLMVWNVIELLLLSTKYYFNFGGFPKFGNSVFSQFLKTHRHSSRDMENSSIFSAL